MMIMYIITFGLISWFLMIINHMNKQEKEKWPACSARTVLAKISREEILSIECERLRKENALLAIAASKTEYR